MLIGQEESIGRKTRQEVKMMQWEQENSRKEKLIPPSSAQTTEEAGSDLPVEKPTKPYG